MKRAVIIGVILLVTAFQSAAYPQSAKQPNGYDYLSMTNAGRMQTVASLIDGAKQGGVKIKQTPVAYCKKLDAFYAKSPDMRTRDLAVVLKTLIIMEYDWSQKGVDKDQLARQFLGEKLYQQNKIRLGKS